MDFYMLRYLHFLAKIAYFTICICTPERNSGDNSEIVYCIDLCHSHYCSSYFGISTIGNTRVNDNSPKVSGYLFVFLCLVLTFVVSHVNLLHVHVSTYRKSDYGCGLSYQ